MFVISRIANRDGSMNAADAVAVAVCRRLATLVDEKSGRAGERRLFAAGHWCRHRGAIEASSRSIARWIGSRVAQRAMPATPW